MNINHEIKPQIFELIDTGGPYVHGIWNDVDDTVQYNNQNALQYTAERYVEMDRLYHDTGNESYINAAEGYRKIAYELASLHPDWIDSSTDGNASALQISEEANTPYLMNTLVLVDNLNNPPEAVYDGGWC